jgi:LmbE family N-acetylglucosaminyl deacetylase
MTSLFWPSSRITFRVPAAFAIFAHPDDIEFVAAGTLLQLKQRGWETHYLNLSTGNCGSVEFAAAKTRRVRLQEAKSAAKILGAHFHQPLVDDLEVLYDVKLLRRIAALVRAAQPSIVLTHSPQDYMEDHTNTARLAVTAAFAHGVPNFVSAPPQAAYYHDVTVYHAMPHGLCDPLRRRIVPGAFVNTTPVQALKFQALTAHQSQQGWLQVSQGVNSYLRAMEDMARAVGKLSGKFKFAEGWRRHQHHGFAGSDVDPLREALGADYRVNRAYEAALARGW